MPDAVSSRRRFAPPPGRLRRLDARLKIVLLIGACFVTQYVAGPWLAAWLAALCCLFLAREMRAEKVMLLARGAVGFTLFWMAMKIASDAFAGAEPSAAALGALPLAGRLAALSIVGIAFVGLSSPIETGRAIAWYLTPLLGRNAWKPALVVALTSWFLPTTLRMAGDVTQAIRARGLKMPWRKKIVLIVGTALRILEHKAVELAVGLASRRIDDYRTWNDKRRAA